MKFTVDWKKAPKWANWAAMDFDGSWYWFKKKPEIVRNALWDASGKHKEFTVIHTTECLIQTLSAKRDDWKDTLQKRPKVVDVTVESCFIDAYHKSIEDHIKQYINIQLNDNNSSLRLFIETKVAKGVDDALSIAIGLHKKNLSNEHWLKRHILDEVRRQIRENTPKIEIKTPMYSPDELRKKANTFSMGEDCVSECKNREENESALEMSTKDFNSLVNKLGERGIGLSHVQLFYAIERTLKEYIKVKEDK